MANAKRREEYPLWVRLTLWGLSGRGSVRACFWLAVGCGVASCIYGYWDWRFLVFGAALFGGALPYWLTIRWVDQHGSSGLRDEFLDAREFESVADAREQAAWFRREYNAVRPHSAPGYKTPRQFSDECDRGLHGQPPKGRKKEVSDPK